MKKALMTVAAMLALSTTVLAEDYDVIRVGVDAPYPPFEYRDPSGELTGFEIELGNAVCNEITTPPAPASVYSVPPFRTPT